MDKQKRPVLGVLDGWLKKEVKLGTDKAIPGKKIEDKEIIPPFVVSEVASNMEVVEDSPIQKKTRKRLRRTTCENLHDVETPPTSIASNKEELLNGTDMKAEIFSDSDSEQFKKRRVRPESVCIDTDNQSSDISEPVIQSSDTNPLALSMSNSFPTIQPFQASGLILENTKIVLTGLFKTCSREDMEFHIKRNGGQCTSAVSGRTDILVTGYILETNKPVEEGSKYKKAKQLQMGPKSSHLRIMTEAEFLDFCPQHSSSEDSYKTPAICSPQISSLIDKTTPSHSTSDPKLYILGSDSLSTVSHPDTNGNETQSLKHNTESILWTEKWRPKRLKEILGNSDTIQKLATWLRDWHDVCILGKVKPPPKPRGGRFADIERLNARACILSGPPGVGKTTAARVVALECGFELLEFNSSDDRGKGIIEIIQDMTNGGQTLNGFLTPNSYNKQQTEEKKKKKVVLIMDEIDGLSASDRGGAQALLKLIEKSLCPVVCICNDRTHPKLKTLASKCYDLRFSKPPKNTVAKRICEIATKEGLHVEYNAAELLCERVGNDLRQILNTLQLLSQSSTGTNVKGITFDMMRKEIGHGLKDNQVMINPFDVTRKLLTTSESHRMTFNDKLDGFFVDYDIMPLYMEENYLTAYMATLSHNTSAVLSDCSSYSLIATVSDCFTFADILNKKVRKDGYWSLLGDVGLYSVVVPSCQASGFLPRADFPKWLGKNSTTTKNRRLLNELNLYLSPSTTATPTAMRVSGYLDLLYLKMITPLLEPSLDSSNQKIVAAKTMALMDEYGITKDHVIENISNLRLKRQEALYDCVESSMKRTLTTLYNNSAHVIRMAPPIFSVKKKSAIKESLMDHTGGGGGAEEPGDEDTAPLKEVLQLTTLTDDDEQDPNESDTVFLDRLILKNKKKPKGRASSKPTPKAKAKAKTKALKPLGIISPKN